MGVEAVFSSAQSSGALIGAIGGAVDDMVDDMTLQAGKSRIAAATGGSADVHVQIEHLVDFYNALSELHEQLHEYGNRLVVDANKFRGMNVGGKVTGITTAWMEMTAGAGAHGSRASMAANLQAVDHAVLHYMDVLHDNALNYAKHEEIAIAGLDKAAGTGGKHHGKKHSKHDKGHDKGHDNGHATGHATGSVQSTPSAGTAVHGGSVLGG